MDRSAILAGIDRRVDETLAEIAASTVIRSRVRGACGPEHHVFVELSAFLWLPGAGFRCLFHERELEISPGFRSLLFPWCVDDLVFGRREGFCGAREVVVPDDYVDGEYAGLLAVVTCRLARAEHWTEPLALTDRLVELRTGFPSIAEYRRVLRGRLMMAAGLEV